MTQTRVREKLPGIHRQYASRTINLAHDRIPRPNIIKNEPAKISADTDKFDPVGIPNIFVKI
jgi:hypothetical protein